jgi:hypothetical protein
MVVQTASKAETVFACAVHRGHNLVQIPSFDAAIYGEFAVWSGAPFEVVFIVDVCSSE